MPCLFRGHFFIEAEPLGFHAIYLGKQLPYLVHDASIGGGGGADRCADGLHVVHAYHLMTVVFLILIWEHDK